MQGIAVGGKVRGKLEPIIRRAGQVRWLCRFAHRKCISRRTCATRRQFGSWLVCAASVVPCHPRSIAESCVRRGRSLGYQRTCLWTATFPFACKPGCLRQPDGTDPGVVRGIWIETDAKGWFQSVPFGTRMDRGGVRPSTVGDAQWFAGGHAWRSWVFRSRHRQLRGLCSRCVSCGVLQRRVAGSYQQRDNPERQSAHRPTFHRPTAWGLRVGGPISSSLSDRTFTTSCSPDFGTHRGLIASAGDRLESRSHVGIAE